MFNETPVVSSTRWALLRLIGICTVEQEQQQHSPSWSITGNSKGYKRKGGWDPLHWKSPGMLHIPEVAVLGVIHHPNRAITAGSGSATGRNADIFIQSLGSDGLCCSVMEGLWEMARGEMELSRFKPLYPPKCPALG